MPGLSAPMLAAGIALLISALVTWYAIGYAHRRRLIDVPGARRSHATPTARGGGIAVVLSIILCGLLPSFAAIASDYPWPAWWLLPATVGIAWVGWIDDHGGLSARRRFVMHCAAAFWTFAAPAVWFETSAPQMADAAIASAWLGVLLACIAAIAVVWSINLHNFMDGINGLLAMQAIFVLSALLMLFAAHGSATVAAQLAVWIAAIAGFVPFNFPRARIFMGDVGSGALGFLIAAAVLWQMFTPGIAAASGIVLCSVFVTDASCTLVSRMWRGRRWYSAHREHLYQWLVRCGHSHARVVAFYMGWNLLIVLPVVYWMNRSLSPDAADGLRAAVAVYVLSAAAWWAGKRWCLAAVRLRGRHAA
jgi:UDP-N-acetylmuramyl pentapeptide phosphotransferase/UDP-N-acetylglucosamine-1-phosphate transferase